MNIKKAIVYILIIVVGLAALTLLGAKMITNTLIKPKITATPTPTPSATPGITDLIWVEKPLANETIKSPLTVKGSARGTWYFEASFPVKLYDSRGKELIALPAQAKGDWMTENFVPFEAVLNFPKPTTETGVLVLEKDNPSGLPEHARELRIPVRFDLNNWTSSTSSTGVCKPTGCSGQICSDQDTITTCEYKAEYACYKSAKCEKQEDGKCGWTPTEKLVTCLSTAFQGEIK